MKYYLEIISLIAQILSFPIAAIAIVVSVRSSKKSKDVEIILNLSESFRNKWEKSWRNTLLKIESTQDKDEITTELKEDLLNILNWIDWLGWLIEDNFLNSENLIINSIGYQLERAIKIGESIIIDKKDNWKGIYLIKEKLKSSKILEKRDEYNALKN